MGLKKRHGNSVQENSGGKKGKKDSTGHKSNQNKKKDLTASKSRSKSDTKKLTNGYVVLVFSIAAVCGILHRNHVAGMFESDRHFSHLSSLERELAFRTEMGLYYSYYKTIIEAPSFVSGLSEIMYDNITEFPLVINTLKRFNLYPEVTLGLWFRAYDSFTKSINMETKQCWKVTRGDGLPPVYSCEGLGDPAYFYIESVFLLNGLCMSAFFLFGVYLSGSIYGGIIAVLSFFYNHGECTRVQWTPPLRESFAFPFLVFELFLVTYILKTPRPNIRHSLLLGLSVVCFMLPWQFSQFALLTQTMAVCATYFLQYIGSRKVKVIVMGQAIGLAISYCFLFGNEMLLTSYYAASLLTVFIILQLEPFIEWLKVRPVIWVVQGILLLVGTVVVKMLSGKILQITDDAHIGEILSSKFTDFKNFHTQLYTCAKEFDFMEAQTPGRVMKTLLLPCALIAVCTVIFTLLQTEYKKYMSSWKRKTTREKRESSTEGDEVSTTSSTEEMSGSEREEGRRVEQNNNEEAVSIDMRYKQHAELVYHLFQLMAYTVMAVIIMRLKLFWTPHLCLFTSLLASRQLFGFLGPSSRHYAVLGLVMALMSIGGITNLRQQWSIQGEFSNPAMEKLVDWIITKTPSNAVFAGPMPVMATVKLCTKRPIVNHPHYEDAGLRARTIKVYTAYSRKPPKDVWENLMDLQVDYFILENGWCASRANGCSMAELFDIDDVANRDNPIPVCQTLRKTPGPYFKKVFKNDNGVILKVIKEPNLNDTKT